MKHLIVLLLLASVALPAVAQDQKAASSSLGQTLTGAFSCPAISVTPPLAPGVPASFPGAISFFSDGNVIAQASGDGPASIEHGAWIRTGDRTFRSTWIGFSQDAQLRYTGPFKVSYNLRLDPDLVTLEGAYRVDFFDTKGTKVFSFSGKAVCTRVAVEDFDDNP